MPETLDPRYPVGKHTRPNPITSDDLREAIRILADTPEQFRESFRGLNPSQVDTPYREGGWTIRQLIHHVADSHTTAVYRVRKALTEDFPIVTGYPENLFAELRDYKAAPAEWSLETIESTHARWVMLLQSLTEDQWQRGFKHAERGPQTIAEATLLYAWHSRHHVAHITNLRAAKGW